MPETTETQIVVVTQIETQANIGRNLQVDFLANISAASYETAIAYLREHGAPEEAVALVEYSVILSNYAIRATAGAPISDFDASYAVESLAAITQLIHQLGIHPSQVIPL
jgi:hypothetical protein